MGRLHRSTRRLTHKVLSGEVVSVEEAAATKFPETIQLR